MLSPIIAVQDKPRTPSKTKGNNAKAQPVPTSKNTNDAPKAGLTVKRSPAQTAEVVKIRKENLLRYMAKWAYRLNMERASGGEGEGSASPSETEFAKVLDISKSYLSLIKSGGKQIHDKLAAQFERRLGMAPGELDREVDTTLVTDVDTVPNALDAPSASVVPSAQGAPGAPSGSQDGLAQFTQVTQAVWPRLSKPQQKKLLRLLSEPDLSGLMDWLKESTK